MFSATSCAPRRSGSQAGHQDAEAEGRCDAEEQGGGREDGTVITLLFCCGSGTAVFQSYSV